VDVLTLAATLPVARLRRRLEAWIRVIGAPHCVEIAPEGLPHRYIVDPRHGLARRPDGIHVVMFRLDDWNNFGCAESGDEIPPESQELVGAICVRPSTAFARWPMPVSAC
jgi:hypothetical protein